MNVLVIGATGTMGTPLVNLLSSRGYHVTAVARKKPKYGDFNDQVEFCVGDAYEKSFMGGVLRKVHYDAIVDFMWRDYTNFTLWFDEMCENTNQYIVLSTAGVYAQNDGYITEESLRYIDDPMNKDDENDYHIEKAKIENYVLQSKYTNFTIVRPHMIFSENNLRLGVYYSDVWLYRALHGLTTVMPKDMLDVVTAYTYAGDVAKEFEMIISNRNALGQVYNLTSDESTTTREVLKLYQIAVKTLGKEMKVKYIDTSDSLCKIIPTAAQRIRKDRLIDRKMSAEKVKSLSENTFQFCNWKETLVDCVVISASRMPEDIYKMIHLHAWMDRQTNERISLGSIRGKQNKIIYLLARYSPSINITMGLLRRINRLRGR